MLATLALAVAFCWPLARVFWFESHESTEYVTRTVEYAAAFAHGDFYRAGPPTSTGVLARRSSLLRTGRVLAGRAVHPTAGRAGARAEARRPAEWHVGSRLQLRADPPRDGREDAALLGACLSWLPPTALGGHLARRSRGAVRAGALPMALFAYRRVVREPRHERCPAWHYRPRWRTPSWWSATP